LAFAAANYHLNIVPFLIAPIRSAFERDGQSGRFTEVDEHTGD